MPHLPQRLKGFDYRTPYFYMVTIHARADLPDAFSAIGPHFRRCLHKADTALRVCLAVPLR